MSGFFARITASTVLRPIYLVGVTVKHLYTHTSLEVFCTPRLTVVLPKYLAAAVLIYFEIIHKKRLRKVKPNYPLPSIWHENKGGNISALEYSCALRAGASYNYLLVNGVRRLTPLIPNPERSTELTPNSCRRVEVTGMPLMPRCTSLTDQLAERVGRSYQVALKRAVKETALPRHCFPATCPYTLEQILDDDFYPDPL